MRGSDDGVKGAGDMSTIATALLCLPQCHTHQHTSLASRGHTHDFCQGQPMPFIGQKDQGIYTPGLGTQ